MALTDRAILGRIRLALQTGNLTQALQAIPVGEIARHQPAITELLFDTALAGAEIGAAATLAVRLGPGAIPRPEVLAWARQRSAGLVAGISEQTRLALREVIAAGLAQGLRPADLAKLLEPMIGLNRIQARAWLDNPTARYAAQLIRQRARVIARHELMQAANAGRRLLWRTDVRNGLIAPDRWEREWVAIVPSDGRTCAYCEGQDGARAPINGAYPDGSDGPPGHVLCRCTEVLVRRG